MEISYIVFYFTVLLFAYWRGFVAGWNSKNQYIPKLFNLKIEHIGNTFLFSDMETDEFMFQDSDEANGIERAKQWIDESQSLIIYRENNESV